MGDIMILRPTPPVISGSWYEDDLTLLQDLLEPVAPPPPIYGTGSIMADRKDDFDVLTIGFEDLPVEQSEWNYREVQFWYYLEDGNLGHDLTIRVGSYEWTFEKSYFSPPGWDYISVEPDTYYEWNWGDISELELDINPLQRGAELEIWSMYIAAEGAFLDKSKLTGNDSATAGFIYNIESGGGGVEVSGSSLFPIIGNGTLILSGEPSYTIKNLNFGSFEGGLILSGTSDVFVTYNYLSEGGLVLNGSVDPKSYLSYLPTGDLILGGEASVSYKSSYLASGSLILGGTVELLARYRYDLSLSPLMLLGTSDIKQSFNYTGTGSLVLAGESLTVSPTYYYYPNGEMLELGGTSSFISSLGTYYASGGLILGGEVSWRLRNKYLGTGGLTLGGSFGHRIIHDYTFTGGLVLSGTSPYQIRRHYIASGGLILGGDSQEDPTLKYTMVGGLELGIESTHQLRLNYTASGELILSGYGFKNYQYYPTGGLILSGESNLVVNRNAYQSSGSLVLSGESTIKIYSSYVADGSLILSGTTDPKMQFNYAASGNLTLGGEAGFFGYTYTMQGGLILSGSSDFRTLLIFIPEGGLILSGDSTERLALATTAEGGLILGGEPNYQLRLSYSSSGSLILGGESNFTTGLIFSSTGTLILSGETLPKIHITITIDNGPLILKGKVGLKNKVRIKPFNQFSEVDSEAETRPKLVRTKNGEIYYQWELLQDTEAYIPAITKLSKK